MTQSRSYLILGNGIAGITAAETLRAEQPAAQITLVTDEPVRAYYRPALKDYLAGHVHEEQLWARPATFYQDRRLQVVIGHVTGIAPANHQVRLQTGQILPYHKLLVAIGAPTTRLICPGATLDGILTLKSLQDYQQILYRLPHARHIIVYGGGTLALETIEMLRGQGHVLTHLVRGTMLWAEVLDATASDLVLQRERRSGVEVLLGESIVEVQGTRGQVSSVLTSTGKQLPCDLLVTAIGITPELGFLQQSGIACNVGVRVNDQMQTSMPDIYAAGDVVETTLPKAQRARLLGLWYPAIQQARAAAYSMLGLLDLEHPFRFDTCYNGTTLYGLDCTSIGITGSTYLTPLPQGFQELVGPPRPRWYRKVVLRQGVVVGLLALGDRAETLAFKRAIDAGVNLLPVASTLFRDDFSLSAWLDQLAVPPPLMSVGKADMLTTKMRPIGFPS